MNALQVNTLNHVNTRSGEAVAPGPFRNEIQATEQRQLLLQEMKDMAANGVITPQWAESEGYMSNRDVLPRT